MVKLLNIKHVKKLEATSAKEDTLFANNDALAKESEVEISQ